MTTTPSGMSIADAEALSRKQQADIRAGLPAEGSYFQMSAGEGAEKLYQMRGGQVVGLGFEYPDDWQGRTIGSWLGQQTSAGLSAIGGSAPVMNRADIDALAREGRLSFGADINDLSQFLSTSGAYQPTSRNILPEPISPVAPEAIAPENSLAGIRSVFGAGWTPSPAFTPALQAKGIYGAVRITGTNEVYTIGTGGRKETAESFRARFGTDEQEGIVGLVSREEAVKLGITDTKQTPVDPQGAITPEGLASETQIDLTGTGGGSTPYTADTTNAGIKKDVEIYNASKSDREKELEEEVGGITETMKGLLEESEGRGAAQLSAEDKEEVKKKQEAEDDAYAEVEIKLAEIETLEADYNLQNQIVEGKTITLARMQGQQAQNYKMFLAQKNLLTSQASLLQAKALALQGKTDRAQEAASRSVDLKYNDIQDRFNAQSALYDIVKGQLTDEQNIRLEALKLYNDQQKTALANQKATEKATYNTLLSQMNQYPDAGIQLTDSLEVANQKITQNSKIYQQQIRLVGTGGIGGFKFSASDYGQLSTIGLTSADITGLQSDIQQVGLEAAIGVGSGFNDEEKTVIRNIMSGRTPTQLQEEEDQQKRTWTDQEIREDIQQAAGEDKGRATISGTHSRSKAMTEVDKERAVLILSEMWDEEKDEIKKQWR